MQPQILPVERTIKTQKGEDKVFIFSKFDAIGGREIVAKYPVANLPKLGEYGVSEETMLKLMAYVHVKVGETTIPLSTKTLVNTHTEDWETLAQIEWGMLEYNCSFFGNGKTSDFFGSMAQTFRGFIISTLTDLSAALSKPTKQR